MEISVLINACGNTPLVGDSIEAIQTFVGKNILMVVDECYWKDWGEKAVFPVKKLQGLRHNYPKAPFRNITYGLYAAVQQWPNSDWFCYCEPDVLFVSHEYKKDLIVAKEMGDWCVGVNHKASDPMDLPLLDVIIRDKLKETHYLLGCCVFYSGDFIRKLLELKFFDRFLTFTNDCENGNFPNYTGYDFGEHLFPSLAVHYGGTIKSLINYNYIFEHPVGDFKKYIIRWKPEITLDEELDLHKISILHPVKEMGSLRWFYKRKRKNAISTKDSNSLFSA